MIDNPIVMILLSFVAFFAIIFWTIYGLFVLLPRLLHRRPQ